VLNFQSWFKDANNLLVLPVGTAVCRNKFWWSFKCA